jgi:Peptidase family M28
MLVSVVVLLFALQVPPSPLPPVVAPTEFNQTGAARLAGKIAGLAPVRTPGSPGDAAVADLVQKRFEAVRDGQVAEQRFSGGFGGKSVDLRNLILTLPGASQQSIVVMASRDSEAGPGAASSAAATAMMLELVNEMQTSRRTKTLVFVSTDGGSDGTLGAREFAAHFPERDLIDGAIVLWQPGSANRRPPALLDTSDGPQSASAGLVRTAEHALVDQAGVRPAPTGLFGELAMLALPSGLGDQAALIQGGIDAVGLSSAGELPLPPAEDQPANLSAATMGAFGRAALLLTATLDAAAEPPGHGPDAYVTLSGSLIPGWGLALLALTLTLPAAIASLDGLGRVMRRRRRIGGALGWAASRGLPLVAALMLLYLLVLIGIVAQPRFPFDPGDFGIGAGEVVVMALLAGVVGAGFYRLREWRVPARLELDAAAAGLGMISVAAILVAWLANPFLALLLVPAAHVWLLDVRRQPLPWPAVLGGAALSLVPFAAALADMAGRLGLGSAAPWRLLLIIGDGQIGFASMIALCLLIGCLVSTVALAAGRRAGIRPAARDAGPRSPEPPTHLIHDQEAFAPDPLDASPIARIRGADDLGEGR